MVRTKFRICLFLSILLFFFSAGILLLASGTLLPRLFQLLICGGCMSIGLFQLYQKAKQERFSAFGILLTILGLGFLWNETLFHVVFSVGFSFFVGLHLLVRAWDFMLYKQQQVPGAGKLALMALVSLLLCILLFSCPLFDFTESMLLLTAYLLLYGLTLGLSHLSADPSARTAEAHRPLRMAPPLLCTVIPYTLLKFCPQFLHDEGNTAVQSDAEIYVHVADTKYGKLGHVDFYFDGQVISFGSYDERARKLDGAMGDGILFFAPKREEYLNFCKSYSHKTIFRFGLRFNEAEKQLLRARIADLLQDTEPWQPLPGEQLQNYALQLQQRADAQFYKFRTGRFKTYFIVKTNCVKMCDTILGSLSLQRPGSILTPGSYYAFLQRELHHPNGRVLYKQVF